MKPGRIVLASAATFVVLWLSVYTALIVRAT